MPGGLDLLLLYFVDHGGYYWIYCLGTAEKMFFRVYSASEGIESLWQWIWVI